MKARVKIMAKKPSQPTPVIPKASKQTKDAIDLFNGKKHGEDVLIMPDNRKERKFKHSQYVETMNDKFFNAIEGKGKYVALAITTAIVSYVVYWMMNQ